MDGRWHKNSLFYNVCHCFFLNDVSKKAYCSARLATLALPPITNTLSFQSASEIGVIRGTAAGTGAQ